MSAYVEHPEHIRAIVAAGLQYTSRYLGDGGIDTTWQVAPSSTYAEHALNRRVLDEANAARVYDVLYRENVRSVTYRYDTNEGDELPGYIGDAPYVWARPRNLTPDPIKVLGIIQGYRSQTCKAPGWLTSEAYAICAAIEHAMITRITVGAPWSIESLEEVSAY